MIRLRVFATHPIQYQVPLWRRIAQHPLIDLKVFYFSDQGVRSGLDKDFGVNVQWDVDLLGGYQHQFLSRDAPLDRRSAMRIPDPESLLRSEAPDWVLIPGYMHGFERQVLIYARRRGVRILMRGEFSDLSHGARSWPKAAARWAYLRGFYSRIDRFCYIGEGARRHLIRHGIQPQQMFFSPYSVDDELIARQLQQISRLQARAKIGLHDGTFTFIISGKLIERKNPLAVLDALRALPDLRQVALIVLGDGELRADVVAKGRELLGERFIFPGFVNQSQLGSYFLASDALLLPSQYETWGLVVNEAMHHGLPVVVSSQVGCAPDLVEHGKTGYVYPAGDTLRLSDCMRLMLTERETTLAMGRAASSRAANYTVGASARGVLEALGLATVDSARV